LLSDDAVLPLACGRIPQAFLPPPTFEPRLRHLADRPAGPLDALAQVQAGDHLGALGLGVGLGLALRRPWYAFAMKPGTGLDAYKIVLYRRDDGFWVAEVPAIAGCYALMPTREEALAELGPVFDMITEEAEVS
jgi:predicted RNase H-like HicB family nuclease